MWGIHSNISDARDENEQTFNYKQQLWNEQLSSMTLTECHIYFDMHIQERHVTNLNTQKYHHFKPDIKCKLWKKSFKTIKEFTSKKIIFNLYRLPACCNLPRDSNIVTDETIGGCGQSKVISDWRPGCCIMMTSQCEEISAWSVYVRLVGESTRRHRCRRIWSFVWRWWKWSHSNLLHLCFHHWCCYCWVFISSETYNNNDKSRSSTDSCDSSHKLSLGNWSQTVWRPPHTMKSSWLDTQVFRQKESWPNPQHSGVSLPPFLVTIVPYAFFFVFCLLVLPLASLNLFLQWLYAHLVIWQRALVVMKVVIAPRTLKYGQKH